MTNRLREILRGDLLRDRDWLCSVQSCRSLRASLGRVDASSKGGWDSSFQIENFFQSTPPLYKLERDDLSTSTNKHSHAFSSTSCYCRRRRRR